ncbi:MAG TPA: AMP-binding protein, partial [Spongiibacteraceae bacterium]|nr:AMP-binding protein [Spongiibacteraceae bacterium]
QNIAMLGFLIVTAVVAVLGANTTGLLLMIAVVALLGTGYTVIKLPQSLVRLVLSFLLTRRYRVRVQGFKFIPERGGVLLLGNHISWIDWAIVQIACPRPVRFVMLKNIYERWYLRRFFQLFGVVPISQGESAQAALEQVAALLQRGEVVCLFPEGAISRSGHLATFRAGYERACALVDEAVVIVPFYLRGLWGSQFSRASAHLQMARDSGSQRDIIVAFGAPIAKDTKVDVLKRRVLDLSVRSWQQYVTELPTLSEVWLRSAKTLGAKFAIGDTASAPLSGFASIAAVLALARKIKRSNAGQNIGLLLPASSAAAIANMAALCAGKTVINLNYTDVRTLRHALEVAAIDTIYTSQQFIAELKQSDSVIVDALICQQQSGLLQQSGRRVIYLDAPAVRDNSLTATCWLLAARLLPIAILSRLCLVRVAGDAAAAIVFTSGSECAPKGVVLSHHNLLGNVRQIADVLNREADDLAMVTLPLFSAFGFTAAILMPLLEGIPVVLYADAADVLGAAKMIAEYRATIYFDTSAHLHLYTRHDAIHPLMLTSLRIVVAGAEKLRDDVRNAFKLKFNKDIYEGYGATETAPVASVNMPDRLDTSYWQVQRGTKPGSVGMPLPGSSCKIVDPDTLLELPTDTDGLILIGGCQIMQGYLNDVDATAAAIIELEGMHWYKTGDKGRMDADGFLTVVDRYTRFAKVGDSRVSLTAVEEKLSAAFVQDEFEVIAVALPDMDCGEKIVALVVTQLEGGYIQRQLQAAAIDPSFMPAAIYLIAAVPKLGNGKIDFCAARELAATLA